MAILPGFDNQQPQLTRGTPRPIHESKIQGTGAAAMAEKKRTVQTICLVAREVDGEVKVFDTVTDEEITDVGEHQARMQAMVAQGLDPEARSNDNASFREERAFSTMSNLSFREPALSMESAPNRPAAAQWDCRSLTKETALARLTGMPIGAFVIRAHDKHFAALAMNKTQEGAQHHMVIEDVGGSLKLKKGTQTFATLEALVEHYSKPDQGDLPCPLVDVFRVRSVSDARGRLGSGASVLRPGGRAGSTGSRTLVI